MSPHTYCISLSPSFAMFRTESKSSRDPEVILWKHLLPILRLIPCPIVRRECMSPSGASLSCPVHRLLTTTQPGCQTVESGRFEFDFLLVSRSGSGCSDSISRSKCRSRDPSFFSAVSSHLDPQLISVPCCSSHFHGARKGSGVLQQNSCHKDRCRTRMCV